MIVGSVIHWMSDPLTLIVILGLPDVVLAGRSERGGALIKFLSNPPTC